MLQLTKWIAAPVMAIGLVYAADAPDAKAQYGCYGPGYGYGYGYGGRGVSIGIGVSRYGVGSYHSSLFRSPRIGVGFPYYGHPRYQYRSYRGLPYGYDRRHHHHHHGHRHH